MKINTLYKERSDDNKEAQERLCEMSAGFGRSKNCTKKTARKFTVSEMEIILDRVSKYGKKWVAISQLFEGATPQDVKSAYMSYKNSNIANTCICSPPYVVNLSTTFKGLPLKNGEKIIDMCDDYDGQNIDDILIECDNVLDL